MKLKVGDKVVILDMTYYGHGEDWEEYIGLIGRIIGSYRDDAYEVRVLPQYVAANPHLHQVYSYHESELKKVDTVQDWFYEAGDPV